MTERKSTLQLTLPSDREVVMTRDFDAPRALVYEAITKPDRLVRWFGGQQGELVVCDVDLRVGGTSRFVWRFEGGSEMGITWVYREISAPDRFVHTETFDEPYRDEMGGETLVTWVLSESEGRTRMTLSTLYDSREARDRALATGMESGAAESFDRLAELLESMMHQENGR